MSVTWHASKRKLPDHRRRPRGRDSIPFVRDRRLGGWSAAHREVQLLVVGVQALGVETGAVKAQGNFGTYLAAGIAANLAIRCSGPNCREVVRHPQGSSGQPK